MPSSRQSIPQTHAAIALVSLGWNLQDGLAIPVDLRRKLSAKPHELPAVLAALTSTERHSLKAAIRLRADARTLAGPLTPGELCDFIDSVLPATSRTPTGQDN